MIVMGLSSGTSADGIDVAVAEFRRERDALVLRPLAQHSYDYTPALREAITAALPPAACTAEAICRIDTGVGQEFAESAYAATTGPAGHPAELICSHGQTLYHWVDGGSARGTLQLGQPAWIAERTGLPVVSDVRARDIAAGGHGAPLAGLLDEYLLAGRRLPAAALNLGGIGNVTVVRERRPTVTFDTGPANALVDAAVHRLTGGAEHLDACGGRAARGTVDEALLTQLLDEPYYRVAPPKSTGKELFNVDYLARVLARRPGLDGDDVLATLTELTAVTVADALRPYELTEVLVSGGGTRNRVLMGRLTDLLAPAAVRPIGELGIDSDAKEAYLFALIGYLTWHGIPITAPERTGASRAPIAGHITPGVSPLRLPEPSPAAPTRLRIEPPST